jgi:hypothetical protein
VNDLPSPTPYAEVNAVLHHLHQPIQRILGAQFVGMSLYGSLALGDFDPPYSDIDFIIVTDGEIDDGQFAALRDLHQRFSESDSPWADRIEAAYVTLDALQQTALATAEYPQIEMGGTLVRAPLEIGWAFQRHTLREHGVPVAGSIPRSQIAPVEAGEMRWTVAAIAGMWSEDAQNHPDWLAWVEETANQSFVVLTLCRLLYALETGDVTSKPKAARWAQTALGERWSALIERALASAHQRGEASPDDVAATLALVEYTLERAEAVEG